MSDGAVGRLLAASLHQGIADLLPTRLEFYEGWLHPISLREGRVGAAPMLAVLSFLRQEGEPYRLVTARSGEYAADWIVSELGGVELALLQRAPRPVQVRLITRVARRLVRRTYLTTTTRARWRRGQGRIDIRGSVFCDVRDRSHGPLCEFYVAAIRRLFSRFNVSMQVVVEECRASGGDRCRLVLTETEAPPDLALAGITATDV